MTEHICAGQDSQHATGCYPRDLDDLREIFTLYCYAVLARGIMVALSGKADFSISFGVHIGSRTTDILHWGLLICRKEVSFSKLCSQAFLEG